MNRILAAAWVIARRGHALDEAAVRDFCRGQIAHFKVPRYVRIVDAFPLPCRDE